MSPLTSGFYTISRWSGFLGLQQVQWSRDVTKSGDDEGPATREDFKWEVTVYEDNKVAIRNKVNGLTLRYLSYDGDPEEWGTVKVRSKPKLWELQHCSASSQKNCFYILLPSDTPAGQGEAPSHTRLAVDHPGWNRAKVVLSSFDPRTDEQAWIFQKVE